jgi:cytochrome P450
MYITLIGAQMFNPEVFKDPTKFEPERWLRDNEMLKQDPYYFCPFSAGPRNCIG